MLLAAQRQIRLHRRTQGIHMAVGVSCLPDHCGLPPTDRNTHRQDTEGRARDTAPPLRADKPEIDSQKSCRTRPTCRKLRVRTPSLPVLDGFSGKCGNAVFGGLVQDRERIGIARVLVRIDQPAHQLVVGISREASYSRTSRRQSSCAYKRFSRRTFARVSGDRWMAYDRANAETHCPNVHPGQNQLQNSPCCPDRTDTSRPNPRPARAARPSVGTV